ncbi:DUF222 domain-containing protein [Microbacterium sp. ARD32]|uniref:HNH endonuclease signature motif containing protein n=1 Tax=Microbacterium sp. ARD32 TaxID=2962577 RepID=UPI002881A969|nr:DUF222 domain-containing protein [Microbacterium sp. ARD32]MDT0157589.1 DUF222 domain-containing protein [Microbacterium sp. ARD32]
MASDFDSLLRQRVALRDAWVAKQQQIARLQAEAAGLLAQRWELFEEELSADPMRRNVIERSMMAEYSAAGHVSKGAMEYAFSDARMLGQFPALRSAYAQGHLTPGHVRHLLAESQPVRDAIDAGSVTPETLGLYERAVLEVAEHDTAARARSHARQVAAALAGTTVVDQQKKAERERSVTVRSVGDGLALLQAVLPEYLAVAIHDRLTRMAKHLSGHPQDREPSLPPSEPSEAEWAAWEAEFAAAEHAEQELVAEIFRRASAAPDDETAAEKVTQLSTEDVTQLAVEEGADTAEEHFAAYLRRRLDEHGYWPDEGDPEPSGPPPEVDLSVWTDPRFDPDSPCIIRLSDDPRSYDQLRADLLADLLLTSDPSAAHGTSLGSITGTIQVTVAATTLRGDDDRPAELDGHGPLHPDAARALAGENTGWTRLFLDPTGLVTETDTYTPTEPMRRFLRARDQHCRFPGCRMPVHRCELDHNLDWALGGPTAIDNLAYFCKTHHTLKHPELPDFARWTARQQLDHTIRWVSPTGAAYPDDAPRRVMFVPTGPEPPEEQWLPLTREKAGSPF